MTNEKDESIVVLCSGGMDSVTLLAQCGERFGSENVHTLFVNYEQKSLTHERTASTLAAHKYGSSFKEVEINLKTQKLLKSVIMKGEPDSDDMMKTYVPARNMLLISLACAHAISIGAHLVGIGVHFDDDPLAYPDCKPSFINPMKLACREYGIELYTPFLFVGKKDIVKKGMELGIEFEETMSCYWPSKEGEPCGKCPSCALRTKGFNEYEDKEDQENS